MGAIALLWLVLAALVAGCGSPEARAEPPAAGGVVDSVVPREEALRRFREGLAPADSLEGGAETLEGLMSAYLRALGAADTATLAGLAVTRAEFAYLYYPTATQARPPYDLEPGLMWFMLFEHSNQGVRRALRLLGGAPVRPVGHDCGAETRREGENLLHGPCTVSWRSERGDTLSARLVSRVLERGGRFKVLTYANDLD